MEVPDIKTLVPESALMVMELWMKSVCCEPLPVNVTVNPLLGESRVDCPVGRSVMVVVGGAPEGVKSVVIGLPRPVTKS